MPHAHEERTLPFSAEQMFDLVADVRSYSEFLPWVVGMRVRADSEFETVADMLVGFKQLREQFTSRVIKMPKTSIEIDYLDGPMKKLHNVWQFIDLPEGGCKVVFDIEFAFKNRIFESLAGKFFESALLKMISAFEARAAQLYI